MFPIFMWIKEYKGIKNLKINLDPSYEIELKIGIEKLKKIRQSAKKTSSLKSGITKIDKRLSLKKLKIKKTRFELPKDFYSKNIENISLLIGKNGTGKSSILELLALQKISEEKIEHFIIYKTISQEEEELYVMEGYYPMDGDEYFEFLKKINKEVIRQDYSFIIDAENKFRGFCNSPNKISEKESIKNVAIGRFKDSIEKRHWGVQEQEDNENGYKLNIRVSRTNLSLKECLFSNVYNYIFKLKKEYSENYKGIYISINIKDCFEDNCNYFIGEKISRLNEKKEEYELEKFKLYSDDEIYKSSQDEMILKNYCNRPYLYHLKENTDKLNSITDIEKENDKLMKKYKRENVKDTLKLLLKEIKDINFQEIYDSIVLFSTLGLYLKDKNEVKFKKNYLSNYTINFLEDKKLEIEKILECYDKNTQIPWKYGINIEELDGLADVYIGGLSDGERAFLNLFSSLAKFLDAEASNKGKIILLFDEIENFLHPEWCRKFLSILIEELEKYQNKIFRLIFATHSPFLISDVIKENCFYIEKKNEKTKVQQVEIKTFGANIHDLLKNGMFMESTFGEFSKKKIREVLNKIEVSTYSDIKNDTDIKFVIEEIGEKLIENKLKSMIKNKEEKNREYYEQKIGEYTLKLKELDILEKN